MTEFTRAHALETAALVLGGVVVGGIVLGEVAEPAATSSPSAEQDAEILNLALVLEHVQSSFYDEAVERAGLSGELLTYARTVAGQEREHLDFLKQALGSAARTLPKLDFGDDTADPEHFGAAALKLEDLGVAAYNGQAPNLTKATLAAAARIVSVEARHAAWIRDLRGEVPAPDAAEPPLDADEVLAAFASTGWLQ